MLLISENTLTSYLRANERFKLDNLINLPRFTVADTPLTYRQVNSLESDKLLGQKRSNKQGWHKFSFKEAVFIEIVDQLKQFGIKHEQLKRLWESFFKEPAEKSYAQIELNKFDADVAIGCVFCGVEIKIAMDAKGEVLFYDPISAIALNIESGTEPKITVTLNSIVNGLLEKIGMEPIPMVWTQGNIRTANTQVTTIKERELLNLIRDKRFSAIRIKRKNGEWTTAYVEKYGNGAGDGYGELNSHDLLKLIEARDYQDINIVKRDGKIVNYRVEETIQL